jgi:hypothetical protein
MSVIRRIQIASMIFLLMAITVHAIADADNIPGVFEYHFKDVDPIKIYAGPVTFNHGGHVSDYGISCQRCHHTLESGETAVEEHCRDCHDATGFVRGKAAEGLSEDELIEHYLNALHAQCINCHKQNKVEDRKRNNPLGCTQCHDRSQLPKRN